MQRRPYQQHEYQHQQQQQNYGNGGNYYQQTPLQDPYSVPHVPVDTNSMGKNKKSGGGVSCATVFILMIVTAALAVGGMQYYIANIQMVQYRAEIQQTEVEPVTEYWMTKYNKLETEHYQLQQSSVDLRRELRQFEHNFHEEKETALQEVRQEMERRVLEATSVAVNNQNNDGIVHDTSHLDRRIQELEVIELDLQRGIQEWSKRAAIEKFGPGPTYRVEFALRFTPSVEATKGDAKYFVIETAPLDDMPHAIYWFLEQVSRGLVQLNSFYINVPHVVQAGPRSKFAHGISKKLVQEWEQSGMSSLLFQEFNPNFTHHPWTIGMAGRPAGPEFYINLHDNSAIHGFGGQGPGGDPCFAKVISGFDTIERMMKSPGLPDNSAMMEHTVGIRSAEVLRN